MNKLLLSAIIMAFGLCDAHSQTFTFGGLTTEDVLMIGRGLDKLPREETDRNNLYQRLQQQINAQNQAAIKANADAQKAAIDKAIAEAKAKEAPP
jgi:hypothetical protein